MTPPAADRADVPLARIAREWGRIGATGFGGPPAHIALLRRLCVTDNTWISAADFEDAIAAVNLLPGPASTQLAIWCGWRLRGPAGAILAGLCFIAPGLVLITALAALFLADHPARWLLGAAAGAGAAVPAVALHAAWGLTPASRQRIRNGSAAAAPQSATRLLTPANPTPAQPGAITPAQLATPPATPAHPTPANPAPEQPGAATTPAQLTTPPATPANPATNSRRHANLRWTAYATLGAAAAALAGPWLVLILLTCGLTETALRTRKNPTPATAPILAAKAATAAGLTALTLTALKVGALSYGGGFVIIPLMQHDAVAVHHWLDGPRFLDAVALGQVTPGPVVLTVAVVGYAAAGLTGAATATAVAFAPSFAFILAGARRFDRLRGNAAVQAFLTGAGPAVIGAIAGAAIPLAMALNHGWQYPLLAAAALWLLAFKRGVVSALVLSGLAGTAAALLGAAVG